jgi:hypothetical protein
VKVDEEGWKGDKGGWDDGDEDGDRDEDFQVIPFPQPVPEPSPHQRGTHLTSFVAHMGQPTFNRDGVLVLKFLIPPEDKYAALPLSDILGRRFLLSAYTLPGKSAVVEDGTLRIYKVRAARKQRKTDREWRKALYQHFIGTPDTSPPSPSPSP